MKRARVDAWNSRSAAGHLYYNCTIVNNNTDPNPASYPIAEYTDTRTVPLIEDIENYDYSVVRFTMDGSGTALPLFIPRIQLGQEDVNLTVYTVGVQLTQEVAGHGTFNGYAYRKIKFKSESWNSAAIVTPAAPVAAQDIRSSYYYVSSYQSWLDMVNETLALCVSDPAGAPISAYKPVLSLQEQLEAFASGTGVSSYPPRITYSGGPGGVFSFICDATSYGCDPANPAAWDNRTNEDGGAKAWLWLDDNLANMFPAVKYDFVGSSGNGQTYRLDVRYQFKPPSSSGNIFMDTTKFGTVEAPAPFFEMKQESIGTATMWSPVSNITFCSNLMQLAPEADGPTVTFGAGNVRNVTTSKGVGTAAHTVTTSDPVFGSSQAFVSNNFSGDGSNTVTKIITDIAADKVDAYGYSGFLTYTPSGEYRISEFQGSGPLRQIEISIFWRCSLTGELIPLTLPNGASVSVKMMFRRKDA